MKIYKRQGLYWITDGTGSDRIQARLHSLYFRVTGEKILPVTNKSVAESLAVELYNYIRVPSKSPGIGFYKAVTEFLHHSESQGFSRQWVRSLEYYLMKYRAQMKIERVTNMSPVNIQRFLDSLQITNQTRNKFLSAIQTFSRFCRRMNWITALPTKDLERYKTVKSDVGRFITSEERRRLLENTDSTFAAVITIAYQTGLRRGAIVGLWNDNWRSVDFENSNLTLESRHSKNRKTWTVPINRHALDAIKLLKQTAAPPMRADWITLKWVRLCRKIQIRARFHDLRHTFATLATQAPIKPFSRAISDLMTHSTSQLAQSRYTHHELEYLRQIVDDLPL